MKSTLKKIDWPIFIPVATLILVFVYFAFASPAFLTERNLSNLSQQVAINCVLAFGMTVVILLGGIDLSVGSVLALASIAGGLLQQDLGLSQFGSLGALVSMLGVLALCAMTGAFNGFMVSVYKMPPFVVTLGLFAIARGLAHILSGSNQITVLSSEYRSLGAEYFSPELSLAIIGLVAALIIFSVVRRIYRERRKPSLGDVSQILASGFLALGLGTIFYRHEGLPVSVTLMAFVFLVIWFLLNKTSFGRSVYAIGGNAEAARLCGIPVARVIFLSFVLLGICVGLSAIIETGRLATADPRGGALYELDAIAAVVIGGTSLQGGVGRIQGTLLGAILIGTLSNGMSLLDVESNYQNVIKGLIIVAAVFVDVVSKKRR